MADFHPKAVGEVPEMITRDRPTSSRCYPVRPEFLANAMKAAKDTVEAMRTV